jgi:hypothetical protein
MRSFTPREANDALREVRPLVERLVTRRRSLLRLTTDLETVRAAAASDGGRFSPARVRRLEQAADAAAAELASLVDELHRLGVQVKDLDLGLVDFPAVHPETGDTVLLCWRLGEAEITHWHRLDEGFAGRKPLPF